jgi:hypothetical protein
VPWGIPSSDAASRVVNPSIAVATITSRKVGSSRSRASIAVPGIASSVIDSPVR